MSVPRLAPLEKAQSKELSPPHTVTKVQDELLVGEKWYPHVVMGTNLEADCPGFKSLPLFSQITLCRHLIFLDLVCLLM